MKNQEPRNTVLKVIEINEAGIDRVEIVSYTSLDMLENFFIENDSGGYEFFPPTSSENYTVKLAKVLRNYPSLKAAQQDWIKGKLHIGILYVEVKSSQLTEWSPEYAYNTEVTDTNYKEVLQEYQEKLVTDLTSHYGQRIAKLILSKI